MAKNLFGVLHVLQADDGAIEPGGSIEVFRAGTSTPCVLYSDRGLTTEVGNVIEADGAGRFPERWIADGVFVKLVYKYASGATMTTRDWANQGVDIETLAAATAAVADNMADVIAVGEVAPQLVIVAAAIEDVETVADGAADMAVVAAGMGDVQDVAGEIEAVQALGAVAPSLPDLVAQLDDLAAAAGVADEIGQLGPVAGVLAQLDGKAPAIQDVGDDIAAVVDVAGIKVQVVAVSGATTNIAALVPYLTHIGNLGPVAGALALVGPVAASVALVGAIDDEVAAVGDNIASVITVAGAVGAVVTAASMAGAIVTVAAANTAIGQVAAVRVAVAALGPVAGAVAIVASNIAAVQALAAIAEDVSTLADVSPFIPAVAAAADYLEDVAGASASIITIAGVVEEIRRLGNMTAALATLFGLSTEMVTLAAIADDIEALAHVAGAVALLGPVAGSIPGVLAIGDEIVIVAGSIEAVQATAAIAPKITAVADIGDDVSAVAVITTEVAQVAAVDDAVAALGPHAAAIVTLAALAAELDAIADLIAAAQTYGLGLLSVVDDAALRVYANLEIGVDVQAHSVVLDATTAAFTTEQEENIAAMYAPETLARFAVSPGFYKATLVSATLTDNGAIVEAATSADVAIAENRHGRYVPGFYDPNLTAAIIDYNGAIISATIPDEGSGDSSIPDFVGPGFADPYATEIALTGDAIYRLTTDQVDFTATGYTPVTSIAPAFSADASSQMAYVDPDKFLDLFVIGGQSLGKGQNTDSDAIISSSPTYPDKAVMPDFPAGATTHIDGQRFTAVTDLIEQVEGNFRETSASALVNHYIALMENATGVQPHVLIGNAAVSAQEYTNLNRGSDAYQDIINFLRDGKAYAASIGKIAICRFLFWNHGQNSTDSKHAPDHYVAAMQQLLAAFTADVRAILGQAEDPVIVMTQIDAGQQRDPAASDFFTKGPPLAQARLHGTPGFLVACSSGHLPLSSDGLHLSCEGYYRQGMAWARAAFAHVSGTGWPGYRVTDFIWRSSTVLDLEMSVPDNLEEIVPANDAKPDISIQSFKPTAGALVENYDAAIKQVSGMQIATQAGLLTFMASPPTVASGEFSLSVTNAGQAINQRFLRITFGAAPTGGMVEITLGMRTADNTSAVRKIGRHTIASAKAYTPIHTLPSGLNDWDFCQAGRFLIPTRF